MAYMEEDGYTRPDKVDNHLAEGEEEACYRCGEKLGSEDWIYEDDSGEYYCFSCSQIGTFICEDCKGKYTQEEEECRVIHDPYFDDDFVVCSSCLNIRKTLGNI